LSIGDDIKISTDLVKFGEVEDEAETKDVYIYGIPSGKVEEDFLLGEGTIVKSVENNADVILMSFGGPYGDINHPINYAVKDAVEAGATVIVAQLVINNNNSNGAISFLVIILK